MQPFEEGWLPSGWEKGKPFCVQNRNFQRGPEMALMCGWKAVLIDKESVANAMQHMNIRLHYSQLGSLVKWLAWYFDNPSDLSEALFYIILRKPPC